MSKVKLKLENGSYMVTKASGEVMTCPFRQMKMVQTGSIKREIIQMNQPCTSDCAKFQTVEDSGKMKLRLYCGVGNEYEYEIEIKSNLEKV